MILKKEKHVSRGVQKTPGTDMFFAFYAPGMTSGPMGLAVVPTAALEYFPEKILGERVKFFHNVYKGTKIQYIDYH